MKGGRQRGEGKVGMKLLAYLGVRGESGKCSSGENLILLCCSLLLVRSKYFGTLTCVLRIQEATGDTVVTRQWKHLLALESASAEDEAWEHGRGLVPSGPEGRRQE